MGASVQKPDSTYIPGRQIIFRVMDFTQKKRPISRKRLKGLIGTIIAQKSFKSIFFNVRK